MIEAIDAALSFVEGVDIDEFSNNLQRNFAVVRALEIIGEAARNVSPTVRRRYPAIAWRDAVDMRNVVAHFYFGVDLEVVWKTVHEDLPGLRDRVAEALEAEISRTEHKPQ
jgi:uncharacterized protein with HEPN domain